MENAPLSESDFIAAATRIFDNFADPVIISSPDSRILYVNPAQVKHHGLRTPSDMTGRYYDEVHSALYENEQSVNSWKKQDQKIAANPLRDLKMLEVHPGEADRPYTVRKTALFNQNEEVMGVLLHFRYLEIFRPNDFIKGKLPGSLLLNCPDDFFTERECEIIFLRLQGMSSTAIAKILRRSPSTIENAIQHMYESAGVNNATDFAEFCENRGLHCYLPHRFLDQKHFSFECGSFEL